MYIGFVGFFEAILDFFSSGIFVNYSVNYVVSFSFVMYGVKFWLYAIFSKSRQVKFYF